MSTTVFFDLETGGVREEHPIIQIAAIAARDGQEIDSFECKLHFEEGDCDPEALKINSYDRETWGREGVTTAKAIEGFEYFCRTHDDLELISQAGRPYHVARLAGHNVVTFDIPRLRAMFDTRGVWLPACWWYPLDTYQRAIWYFTEHGLAWPKNFRLTTLADHFGIKVEGEAHDALVDVRMNLAVANRLVGRFE